MKYNEKYLQTSFTDVKYIAFTQSHRSEETIFDSYVKTNLNLGTFNKAKTSGASCFKLGYR